MTLDVDRFLRYDEMAAGLRRLAADHPELVEVDAYGSSHEGRALLLVTITDRATGAHDTKPAHWIDANIHATEVTGGVAALHVINHLVTAAQRNDRAALAALATRAFYIAPRVNPDGVEAALADAPVLRRSSMRPWPDRDGRRWPGLNTRDIDGDGMVLTMRVPDPNGAWVEHPDDERVMIPVPIDGVVDPNVRRYRLLAEGEIEDYDGFTVPRPRPPEGLDMNRNFPAGWSTSVVGSGDHPLSEPEIDALVRAILARPNICGYNAFHTSGGVLLRPSSTAPDSALPPHDVWIWNELGRRGSDLTGYAVHSVFEDFTPDKSNTMSGAADDWAYEHLGVFSWTTEFWDVVQAATGEPSPTNFWTVGPTPDQELAIARWSDDHGQHYFPWRPFEHPQLGPVEIGGGNQFSIIGNAPLDVLVDEIRPHAAFAVFQALAAPCLEIVEARATALGDGVWQIDAGIANTGWLPTDVSVRARTLALVGPIVAELIGVDGAAVEIVGGHNRVQLGQLAGRSAYRVDTGARSDGTPDRTLARWVVRCEDPTLLTVDARHPRAGSTHREVVIAG